MTEKRSDYRKKQKQSASKSILDKVRSAFIDDDNEPEDKNVDGVPEFRRENEEAKTKKRPLKGNGESVFAPHEEKRTFSEEKGLRLKKRLNSAILIVFVLIVLVLLALFHL